MEKDNNVYLLVGQRGAGKSHYAGELLKKQTELSIVSRDQIAIRIFGSDHHCPYTGEDIVVYETMFRLMRRKLTCKTGLRLILDAWTTDDEDRKYFLERLRQYGASRITALYFTTPVEAVSTWFWQKTGITKSSDWKHFQGNRAEHVFYPDDAPARDHIVFHTLASGIDADGFDEVIRINPLDGVMPLQL